MYKEIVLKLKLTFIPSKENKYRPNFLEGKFLFYCVIGLLVLKLITIPFFAYFPRSIFFADITKTALVRLLNQERGSLGIQSLNESQKLNEAAYLKARDMIEKDYFSHQSPDGLSPWYWFKQVGYNYKSAGENLAIGFLDSEEVNQAWLDSPSHKANLLNPDYNEVGIAIARGDFQGNKTTVVVQLFGTPQTTISSTATKEEPIPAAEIPKKEETLSEPKAEENPQENILPEKEQQKEEPKEQEEVLPEKEEESVISGGTSPQTVESTKAAPVFNFFQFISFNYHDLIQNITYGALILIIVSLMINIFVKFNIQRKDLILKTIIFIVILISFVLLDKGVIIQLIPHKFSIY